MVKRVRASERMGVGVCALKLGRLPDILDHALCAGAHQRLLMMSPCAAVGAHHGAADMCDANNWDAALRGPLMHKCMDSCMQQVLPHRPLLAWPSTVVC